VVTDSPDERRFWKRFGALAQRIDRHPSLVAAARRAREMLPGDAEFGDSLSTAGREQPHLIGRRLTALTAERPGLLRETGLSALQVWQALSEAQGRGRGVSDTAIVFTDLVDFSEWALEAGDDAALRLLRCLDDVLEPAVRDHDGEIVKRLGDGMMASFVDAQSAVEAALDAQNAIREIEVDGFRPRMRAGVHWGRPRRLGGDYLGVDVNVAARITDAARAEQVLVSEALLARLDGDGGLQTSRPRRLRADGAPSDLRVVRVSRD
jgi:adenylate cyclase